MLTRRLRGEAIFELTPSLIEGRHGEPVTSAATCVCKRASRARHAAPTGCTRTPTRRNLDDQEYAACAERRTPQARGGPPACSAVRIVRCDDVGQHNVE